MSLVLFNIADESVQLWPAGYGLERSRKLTAVGSGTEQQAAARLDHGPLCAPAPTHRFETGGRKQFREVEKAAFGHERFAAIL